MTYRTRSGSGTWAYECTAVSKNRICSDTSLRRKFAVCSCMCVYVCSRVCLYVCSCMCLYVCSCMCLYVFARARVRACIFECACAYVRRDGVRYVRTNACTNTPIRTPNHVEHGLHIQDRDHTIQFRVLGFRLPAMSSMACSFRTVTTPSVNTATLGLPCAAQQQ